jgi:hypothetical protein
MDLTNDGDGDNQACKRSGIAGRLNACYSVSPLVWTSNTGNHTHIYKVSQGTILPQSLVTPWLASQAGQATSGLTALPPTEWTG